MRFAVMIIVSFLLSGCLQGSRGGTALAPLEISGVLIGQTVLQGYVLVTADVHVPSGSTLVVEPGTTILVRDSESTKIDPEYLSPLTEILVAGTLLADGTAEEPIMFLPEKPLVGEPQWAGLILDRATNSVVRNATITGAETALHLINSSPEVSSNRISDNRYGIIAQGGAAKILDNEIVRGESGVYCWNGTRAYLKGNMILANDEEGIVVDSSSRPYIDRNSVVGNDIGLVAPENTPYDPTMIKGNRRDLLLLKKPEGGAS